MMQSHNALRVGRFDSRTHAQTIQIGPYGRHELGKGVDTFTLVSCDAVAAQLIVDGRPVRWNEGATLPANGVQRYIRNPYSRTMNLQFLEGLHIDFARRVDELGTGHEPFHRKAFGLRNEQGEPDKRAGMVIMSRRGGFRFKASGWSDMKVSLIAEAKPEYADMLPDGVLSETGFPIDSDGLENDGYVCRYGGFTDADMAKWIMDTGWQKMPVTLSEHISVCDGCVGEGAALFIANGIGRGFEVNLSIYDTGDWNPEWLGS